MRRILIVLVLLVAGLVGFDYLAPHQAVAAGVALERWRSHLTEAHATVGGLDIAYLQGGAGEPLVLVHGFGADKDNFTRVARFLTPHDRVVIPDLPGFGESSKPDNLDYGIADQVERLHALTQQLGLTRFHLGGSSMGGHISMAYAVKYPGEVASLWLLDPGGTKVAYDSELRRHYLRTREILLLAKTPADFPRIMDFVMAKQPFFPHSFKAVLGERAAANYPLHSRIFAELNDHPYLMDDPMQHIEAPALIVWGKQDRVLNPKAVDTLKQILPHSQAVLMDGIGHLPMIEAPEQVARDYLAFRQALPATATAQ